MSTTTAADYLHRAITAAEDDFDVRLDAVADCARAVIDALEDAETDVDELRRALEDAEADCDSYRNEYESLSRDFDAELDKIHDQARDDYEDLRDAILDVDRGILTFAELLDRARMP